MHCNREENDEKTFWVSVLAYLNSTTFDLQTGNGTASVHSKYNCNSHCLIFNGGGDGGAGGLGD